MSFKITNRREGRRGWLYVQKDTTLAAMKKSVFKPILWYFQYDKRTRTTPQQNQSVFNQIFCTIVLNLLLMRDAHGPNGMQERQSALIERMWPRSKNKQMIIRGGVLQLKQMFCDTSIYEQGWGWDRKRSENRRMTLKEVAILIANCDNYRKRSDIRTTTNKLWSKATTFTVREGNRKMHGDCCAS